MTGNRKRLRSNRTLAEHKQGVSLGNTVGSTKHGLAGPVGSARGIGAPGVRGSASGPSAGAGASTGFSTFGLAAALDAHATLGRAEGTAAAQTRMVGPETERLGLHGQVDGGTFVGAEASAKGNAGVTGLGVGADAFAGARADASATGSVIWEKGESTDMIKDFADNLPGNWDDALLDQIPDKVYEQVAETLLGEGTVRLLAAEVGAGGRAGAGAEASASLKAGGDGLVSVGAKAGASVGLGAALRARVSVNPLELLRLAVVRRIRTVNSVVGALESSWKRFRGE